MSILCYVARHKAKGGSKMDPLTLLIIVALLALATGIASSLVSE
jgi:hypothetical protein